MNPGLLWKIVREVRLGTTLVGIGLFGVNILLTILIPKVQQGVDDMFDRLPFAREMMEALIGTEMVDEMAAQAMTSVLWVHPIVLSLLWFQAISFSTRVPAGETDRGTIDFLLGLPVSRRQVFWNEVLVFVLTGAALIAIGFAGHRFASPRMPEEMRPDMITALMIMTNLYCVYLAVGGFGFLISSLNSSRAKAIAIVFGVVLASFLLNFAAQLWEPAQQLAFLGILEYYRPAIVMHTGEFPTFDVAVLATIAAIGLIAGSEVTARRSICTT